MKKTFFLSLTLFILPFFANAQSYNFYVNKNYSGQEEGTSEKPFRSISQAVYAAEKERPGLRKIFISEGEYDEVLSLSDSVKLFGQSKENTILKVDPLSTMNLAGNNVLQNLTISGGHAALMVKGNAIIDNCKVKDAKKKGIDLTEGSSLVKISNSIIENNGGKGVYVQKGRWVLLTNNKVDGNQGEGFDIRQSIFGLVLENQITNNTESGIEILTSASDVTIKNNQITGNLANGIANQSYPEMPDLGKINIENNVISGNGKYGIYCGAPSGGLKTKTFFSESIALTDNMNTGNKGKSISGACHFERQTSDFLGKISSDIESKINQKIADLENFYQKQEEIDNALKANQEALNTIKNSSWLEKIFVGVKENELKDIEHRNNIANSTILALSQNQSSDVNFSQYLETSEKEISLSTVTINKSRRLNTLFWLPINLVSLFK